MWMVPISMADMKKKKWLKSLCVMSIAKVFAIEDAQPTGQPDRQTQLRQIYMLLIWIKNNLFFNFTVICFSLERFKPCSNIF